MPLAQVTEGHYYGENPASRPITIHAEHVSFLSLLRIIASVTGCQLTFSKREVVLTNIYAYEFTSFMFPLDMSTKARLGLGHKTTADDIKAALVSRGLDCSRGDITVDLVATDNGDLLVIGGFMENAEMAKSILALSKAGYEVSKRDEPQAPPGTRGE